MSNAISALLLLEEDETQSTIITQRDQLFMWAIITAIIPSYPHNSSVDMLAASRPAPASDLCLWKATNCTAALSSPLSRSLHHTNLILPKTDPTAQIPRQSLLRTVATFNQPMQAESYSQREKLFLSLNQPVNHSMFPRLSHFPLLLINGMK